MILYGKNALIFNGHSKGITSLGHSLKYGLLISGGMDD